MDPLYFRNKPRTHQHRPSARTAATANQGPSQSDGIRRGGSARPDPAPPLRPNAGPVTSYDAIRQTASADQRALRDLTPLHARELNRPTLRSSQGNSHRSDICFPRLDSDGEKQRLESLVNRRGLSNSNDQKWNVVEREARIGRDEARMELATMHMAPNVPPPIDEGTPEWYVKKCHDETITYSQASSLLVSLRGSETTYVCGLAIIPNKRSNGSLY